jgi:hypothetical protein
MDFLVYGTYESLLDKIYELSEKSSTIQVFDLKIKFIYCY